MLFTVVVCGTLLSPTPLHAAKEAEAIAQLRGQLRATLADSALIKFRPRNRNCLLKHRNRPRIPLDAAITLVLGAGLEVPNSFNLREHGLDPAWPVASRGRRAYQAHR